MGGEVIGAVGRKFMDVLLGEREVGAIPLPVGYGGGVEVGVEREEGEGVGRE